MRIRGNSSELIKGSLKTYFALLTKSPAKPLKQIFLDFSLLKELHTNKFFLSTL